MGEPDPERYVRHGAVIAEALLEAARDHGEGVAQGQRVLDFGCGCGRTLRYLRELPEPAALHGCDIDAEAIAWTQAHLRDVTTKVTRSAPPLPYADATFATVFSVSTLTHMADSAQDQWLRELSRILVPGGLALLSVHGPFAFEHFRSGAQRGADTRLLRRLRSLPELEDCGFAFAPYSDRASDAAKYPGINDPYGLAFHSESHVRERWSPWFRVLEIRPRALIGWQDLVIARRR